MEIPDLVILADGFRGAAFSSLIQHHFRKQSMEQIVAGIEGTKLLLNSREAKVAERIIDYFNIQILTREFWKRDCADVLLECYWLANNCLDQDTDEIQWAEYAAGLMLKTIQPPPKERPRLYLIYSS